MRILCYELRRIWRLPVLLVLLALGAMQYFLFMDFSIRYFPNGHPAIEQYELAREWTEKYGTTMEPEEYEDAKRSYEALLAEADAQIAADPRFTASGVMGWEDFRLRWNENIWQEEPPAEDLTELQELLYGEACGWIGYRIEALSTALSFYENRAIFTEVLPEQTPAEQRRAAELAAGPGVSGIFPEECTRNLSEYMCWAGVFAVLSTAILLTPNGAQANLSRTSAEQWTTRTGRRTVWYQFAAALLSAAGLFLLEYLIFGSIYTASGAGFFWDSPTQSFLSNMRFCFDLTYGQYVLCLLGMALLLMLGTAGLAFVLSHSSTNHVSAILKVLPLAAAEMFGMSAVLSCPFTDWNTLYQEVRVMGIEAMACGLILAIGLAAGAAFALQRARKELL